MKRQRKRDNQRARKPSSARCGKRVVSWVSGGICSVIFVGILAYQLFPTQQQVTDSHGHPAAPHSGQLVIFKAGLNHYHVEFVVEATGVIHLYPLDETATQPLPVESQQVVFTVQNSPADEAYSVMLRPVPEKGTTGETTTRFVGRLPSKAIFGNLLVRFTEFKVRGERFRFEFDWISPIGEQAFRSAFDEEQRRILLSPAGKYLESDIRTNRVRMADEKHIAATPKHDTSPKNGERICPVSGFKSVATISWVIDGQAYWFCCQPCIDEFVLRAKQNPEEVKPAKRYVR